MNRSSSRESPISVCWYPGVAGERPNPGKPRATQRKRLRRSWMIALYIKDQPMPGGTKNKVGPVPHRYNECGCPRPPQSGSGTGKAAHRAIGGAASPVTLAFGREKHKDSMET